MVNLYYRVSNGPKVIPVFRTVYSNGIQRNPAFIWGGGKARPLRKELPEGSLDYMLKLNGPTVPAWWISLRR